MIRKTFLFLFIGLSLLFLREIKAEDICKYSNYNEYKKCKKAVNKIIPKYPIENFHWSTIAMGPCISCVDQAAVGNAHRITELKAFSGDNLQVSTGSKTVGLFGLTWRRPFIDKKTIKINPNKILSLNKRDYYFQRIFGKSLYREYKIKYIDDYGNVESLKFEQLLLEKTRNFDIVGDYLIYASNLNWGEEKSVKFLREKYLKENEKNLTIIKSIIKLKADNEADCFEAKNSKFPELTVRYKNLYKTINPLRAKLDLPLSTEIKPICNLESTSI